MEDELKVKWRVGECLSGETEVPEGGCVPMPLRPPQMAGTTFGHSLINFDFFRRSALQWEAPPPVRLRGTGCNSFHSVCVY